MDSNRLTMSGRLEYGLELLPLVGLLGELYTEILAIDQLMRMVKVTLSR